MKKKMTRFKITSYCLLFWTLFIGIGAVFGASGMLLDPSGKAMGMDTMLPYFQVLPFADILFQDYTFSGFALLIVNGLTNLVASFLIIRKHESGIILGGIFGITLMLWICIQFVIFPLNIMSTSYFIFGFCQMITGYMAYVFLKQETFHFDSNDYLNIGTKPQNLVVYFSRMNYVKKIAYEKANQIGACIYEIKALEPTKGTLGFWWCGRFAMHRWPMAIESVDIDLSSYEHVTICTPIWVFSLASPVREFCKESAGKIRDVDYLVVHHTKGYYKNVVKEMDTLLGMTHTACTNIQCKIGKFKKLG
ncbi:MAG: hypothetical protein ACI4U3_08260 [Traorella sp.]